MQKGRLTVWLASVMAFLSLPGCWDFNGVVDRCVQQGRCVSVDGSGGATGTGGASGGIGTGGTGGAESGPQLYLDPDKGDDGNPGTLQSPWKTLNKVMESAKAGDTVNVFGGRYTKTQYLVAGTAPLTWSRNALATKARGTAGKPITLRPIPGQTVVFDGVQSSTFLIFTANDATDFAGFYVVLKGFQFEAFTANVLLVSRGSRAVAIEDCVFKTVSHSDNGGSAVAVVDSSDVIIRNNVFSKIGQTPPAILANQSISAIGATRNVQNIWIDNNDVRQVAGFAVTLYTTTGTNDHVVIRNNLLANARSTDVYLASIRYSNTYLFGNTMVGDQSPYSQIDTKSPKSNVTISASVVSHVVIKNNVVASYLSFANLEYNDSPLYQYVTSDFNLWFNSNSNAVLGVSHLSGGSAPVGVPYTRTGSEYRSESGAEGNSFFERPSFEDEAAGDYRLKLGAPTANKGDFLTLTVGAGNGRVIPVVDSGYFSDGLGMVDGDTVQIGSEVVQIVSINRTNHTLTVNRDIQWGDKAGVALPYKGSRPDIGKYERE